MAAPLTIGMACYDDFDGVYFTTQALRLYQDVKDCEILVVDNRGDDRLARWCARWGACRYQRDLKVTGTAHPRQRVFELASCDWVLCLDCHVLLYPGAVRKLRAFIEADRGSDDLLQGPLLHDDLKMVATHFRPEWRGGMWGVWACDRRGVSPEAEPFEVPMQGLGCFCARRDAFPGFNPLFRGYGGEEGYLHARYKFRGNRTLCLPFLRWTHRFGDGPTPYPNRVEDRLFNYLVGHAEVGLPLEPIIDHFLEVAGEHVVAAALEAARRAARPTGD